MTDQITLKNTIKERGDCAMNTDTIIISTHADFMGEFDSHTVGLYQKYAAENLAALGYADVIFDSNQQTYSINAPISRSSDEYRELEDAIEAAWLRVIA